MKKFIAGFYITIVSLVAQAAAPFDAISIQGFLKTSGGTPVDGTFNGKVSLYQNSILCWDTGGSLVPIVFSAGAFSKTVSGGSSSGSCSGPLGSSQFLTTAPFTWTLDLDMDSDTVAETNFTNIPITAMPFAMVAEKLSGTLSTSQLSGTITASSIVGGTFGSADGAAITNLTASNLAGALPAISGAALFSLNASSLSSGTVATARLGSGTADATTYLRGDGTWQNLPAAGEVNTGSSLGSGSAVFKQKTGVNLEFRSLVAGSTKLSLTTNADNVSLDIAEANLSLLNLSGNLPGDRISGGTFGAVDGSLVTNLNASNIATGTVGAARLPQAAGAADGIVTSGTQTIGGAKTFSGAATFSSNATVGGKVAYTKSDSASTGNIACLASTTSVVRMTGTVARVLQGISPGTIDGQIMIVYTDGNIGTGLTIAHNNASACANGRIFTNTNANVISATASSVAAFTFIYNLSSSRWHMITSMQ